LRALRGTRAPAHSRTTDWHRLGVIAALATLAVVAPATAAYATDTVVADRGQVAVSDDPGLVVRTGTVATDLSPGNASDVSLLVTNTTAGPLTARSVDLRLGDIDSGPGCGPADFTVTTRVETSTTIPAGQTRELVLSDVLRMNSSAGDGCQGVLVNVTSTVKAG
jgi:hypothetical protein